MRMPPVPFKRGFSRAKAGTSPLPNLNFASRSLLKQRGTSPGSAQAVLSLPPLPRGERVAFLLLWFSVLTVQYQGQIQKFPSPAFSYKNQASLELTSPCLPGCVSFLKRQALSFIIWRDAQMLVHRNTFLFQNAGPSTHVSSRPGRCPRPMALSCFTLFFCGPWILSPRSTSPSHSVSPGTGVNVMSWQ